MGQHTTTVTDSDFESAISSDTPTLVDFWAEWCGPCKIMNGPLEELAEENSGKLTIAKLNIDENPGIASAYSVMSIPTMIMFQNGEEKKRFIGARSKTQLAAELVEFTV
jgi:thioredoxin 1